MIGYLNGVRVLVFLKYFFLFFNRRDFEDIRFMRERFFFLIEVCILCLERRGRMFCIKGLGVGKGILFLELEFTVDF